jgi:molecular chaperone DnaJ
MARRDYYAVLGVRKNASTDELRKAFRALALKYHPDRNPGDAEAERRFREVAEAWEVLGDAEQRARFDRLGPLYTPSGRPPGPDEINDLLKDALGGLFGRRRDQPGEDLRHTVTVSLEDVALGCERVLTVPRIVRCRPCDATGDAPEGRTPCAACSGTGKSAQRRLFRSSCAECDGRGYRPSARCARCGGEGRHPLEDTLKLRVPAGVATGQKLKLKGKGNEAPGRDPGPAGDLLVVVNVDEHALFRRRGADLLCEVPITYAEAVLGADVPVPLLVGSTVIRVPPGTASGTSFRLAGRGLPSDGTARGDLHARVFVEIPANVTSEQRAALVDLSRRLGVDAHARRRAYDEAVRSRA